MQGLLSVLPVADAGRRRAMAATQGPSLIITEDEAVFNMAPSRTLLDVPGMNAVRMRGARGWPTESRLS